jgi:hypothetical protein
MSLGPNGANRICLLQKIKTRLRGTNFCTTSARFALSFVRQPNGPKCIQIVQNTPKHEFRVQWVGSGVFVTKNSDVTLWHELLHQVGPFCIECCNATKLSQMHQNSSKRTETWGYAPMVGSSLGTKGSIRCVRCEKFRRDFMAQTFASAWPVLHWVM